MELNHVKLREVGMQFNLVDNWFVLGISQDVNQDWDCTVAYTNVLDKTGVDKSFHFSPDFVDGGILDWVLIFPHHNWGHPMDEVEINVFKLKSLQASSEGSLNIKLLAVPYLGHDKNIFSLDSSSKAFLKSFTDGFFVSVERSSIDLSIAMFKDS